MRRNQANDANSLIYIGNLFFLYPPPSSGRSVGELVELPSRGSRGSIDYRNRVVLAADFKADRSGAFFRNVDRDKSVVVPAHVPELLWMRVAGVRRDLLILLQRRTREI